MTDPSDRLAEALDASLVLSMVEGLCRIPSVSGTEGPIGDWCAAAARNLGSE